MPKMSLEEWKALREAKNKQVESQPASEEEQLLPDETDPVLPLPEDTLPPPPPPQRPPEVVAMEKAAEAETARAKKSKLVPPKIPVRTPKDEKIPKTSKSQDKNDNRHLTENRERYTGFHLGHYIQTPPMVFTQDGHNVFLGDMYRGACGFLILGGPSMKKLNLELLKAPGILTMGVNNSVKTFRPNLWTCVDNPQSFIMSIWMDPTIQKIVPYSAAEKKLFDNNTWKMTDIKVGQCPNVFYYRRNEHFQVDQFMVEDTFNWGNHSNLCRCGYWRPDTKKNPKAQKVVTCPECGQKAFGSRSVFLPAIRLMYFLGVRTLLLLGCDFNMERGKSNYHFDQDRAPGSVSGNNGTYKMLTKRFTELKPIFDRMGYNVFNCNPDSHLDVFPKVNFEDAIRVATQSMPDTTNERTAGLYDREKV